MVYNGLQSSFVSLAGPWSGRSLPQGNQWECWDPGLRPNVVGHPVLLLASDQPKAWQVDILSHDWLAGQLQLASWLAGWLPTEQSVNCTLPPGRDILWPCVWWLWSHWPDVPPIRDISWPSVVLLWSGCPSVRCTPLLDTSHDHMWYYCEQADLWSDIIPPHETSGQVRIWSDVRSGQHHVRCTPHL